MVVARKKKEVTTIEVEVLPIGGTKRTVVLEEGATIEDAIEAAGIDPEDAEPRVDGEVVELEDEVEDGDSVVVMTDGKIEGGR